MKVSGPLAGRRIVITRAEHQGSPLRDALEALGATVISMPTIEIVPPDSYDALDGALRRISDFQWLVVTSANAVAALGQRAHALSLPLQNCESVQIAAIGSATASAVATLGLRVSLTPARYVAEELAGALREHVSGARVLIVRARVARDVIPDALRGAGAHVEVIEAYQTVVPAAANAQIRALLARKEAPDAVAFASSSSVRHFVALLENANIPRPERLLAVSIGPITSATLRSLRWEPAAEALEATTAGLTEACARLLSQ